MTGQSLFLAQILFHLDLGGDTGMVGAGQPQRGIAPHALVTDQNILRRFIQRVSHVQLSRNVRGRDHNREGLFVGIGFSGERGLKLEAYVQGIAGVESIGIYERLCEYPSSYKSYYIDRENHLVGIPVQDWEEWERGNAFYLLLHYDGYKFREVKCLPLHDYRGLVTRATVIDGWLYVFCGPEFIVEQVY